MSKQIKFRAMPIETPATGALTSPSIGGAPITTDPVNSGMRAATGIDVLRGTFTVVIGLVALILVALATPVAYSRSPEGNLDGVPIDKLKRAYLSCDRAAISGRLDTAGIMYCSIVYEELKRRAFGGDFDHLIAWSKAQSTVRNTAR